MAALDAKFVTNPNSSIYEGTAPYFVAREAMADFDREIVRYRDVIVDADNPVARLRIVASTERAAEYLGDRARALLGANIDLQVVVVKP